MKILIVALVVVGGVFWYLQSDFMSPSTNESDSPSVPSQSTSKTETLSSNNTDSASDEAGVAADASLAIDADLDVDDSEKGVTLTVEGTDHKFSPNKLEVKKGQTVTVVFNNSEGFHDFVIDEFSGAKTAKINAGASETITFVADKAGSFEYYCSVGKHRQMGMWGTLVVTE